MTKSGDRRKPLAELLAVKLMKSECKGGKGSGMEESEPSPGDLEQHRQSSEARVHCSEIRRGRWMSGLPGIQELS